MQHAVARHGAARVGVLVGTSTSGILQTEMAYRQREADGALPAWLYYAETHDTASLARFVQGALGLAGPAWVISTACSSGAKACGAAARLIALGVIDAAVVGGCDTLCMTTLYGFRALECWHGCLSPMGRAAQRLVTRRRGRVRAVAAR